jgi:hypothetical protein
MTAMQHGGEQRVALSRLERNSRLVAQVSVSDRIFYVMTRNYEIRSGRRSVTIRSAGTAQDALLDYVRSLGCRDSEIVRLGGDAIAWRGARFSAVLAPSESPA